MRVFVALFLAILSTSFAVRTNIRNEQQSLDVSKLTLHSNSYLGEALKGLLQMTNIDEVQEVTDIISSVREELRALLADTETNKANEQTTYETLKGNYESTISDIETEIHSTQVTLGEALSTKSDLESSIAAAKQLISDTQDAYSREVTRRAETKAAHAQTIADLSDAIAACEEALKLMDDIRGIDLPNRNPAFLQTASDKIKSHLAIVNEKLSKLKLSNTITPFLKVLVEVAQDGVNWVTIDKIIALIKELRDSLIAERDNVQTEDDNDASYSETALKNLQDTIDSTTESLHQQEDLLTKVTDEVNALNDKISSLNESLTSNQDALKALNDAWAEKSSNYDAAMERLRKDIEALGAALDYLAAQ